MGPPTPAGTLLVQEMVSADNTFSCQALRAVQNYVTTFSCIKHYTRSISYYYMGSNLYVFFCALCMRAVREQHQPIQVQSLSLQKEC